MNKTNRLKYYYVFFIDFCLEMSIDICIDVGQEQFKLNDH